MTSIVEAETFEQTRCPVCDGGELTEWAKSKTLARYVRCRECGTLYANPRSPRSERHAWLNEAFTTSKDWMDLLETRRPALGLEAALLRHYLRKGRILDIGCSTGVFFDFFPVSNWQRFGVELSPTTAEFARRVYHADVRVGTLREANFPDKYFDLITLIDTICYFEDPFQDLCEAARLLREEGILAIELPGQAYIAHRIRGLLALFLNRHWIHVDPSSSYIFWPSPHSLTALLNCCGFEVIEWRVIPSPRRNSFTDFLSRTYFNLMAFLAERFHYFLTWAPKYICIARLNSQKMVGLTKGPSPSLVAIQKALMIHASRIARLHYKYIFPNSEKTQESEQIEIPLLTAYYHELIRREDCAIHVAIQDHEVIGYCSLVSDHRKAMAATGMRNPRAFLRGILSLELIRYGWQKLFHEGLGQKWQDIETRPGVEVRSIAVEETYRGNQLGFQLLNANLEEARNRKWDSLIAWVAEDNKPSGRLFERAGFSVVGEKVDNSSVVHLYQLRLGNPMP